MRVVMDIFRSHHGDAGVTVFGIVPGEESSAERAGIFDGAEAFRISGPILECFESRFREWIVIGNVRPGMGLGYSQIGQELGEGS